MGKVRRKRNMSMMGSIRTTILPHMMQAAAHIIMLLGRQSVHWQEIIPIFPLR
jgi:hypothetical protein